ncbi:MAG: protein tyrosine phosphatase [Gammaproteobacteria bacterium]|uniref:arsenate reductase/protein-tyrosine-phosphatase family protein n=1 Tax=Acidovorax sp. TaxID=1872122 RepID=UPI00391C0A0F|nr:protein tyrosine phosphatase [Gammaproteobacteria bacterium]MBU1507971.1 protein tyrosine phosphatase [Gammaproteobacteria bacterium]MBU2199349.1 protein tyrosine phosphatase [Gammaproteobacteria bacterium]MBU2275098.1 protein tyrosine phosphatase [Gammaproteobacteria bacterium]MBU2356093.1 protein tyrosine phosphatase [Gammaproteobacteria bacterium]
MSPVPNVLFVSVENALRSQLAEACLRHVSKGRFNAYSCGMPGRLAPTVSPVALEVLHRAGMPIARLSPKSWDLFRVSGPTRMDFVISLDAETASEHPAWASQPELALWSYPPLLWTLTPVVNRERRAEQVLLSLQRRIELLVSLHAKVKHRSELRSDLRDLAYM